MAERPDYYDVLGISPKAPPEVVRAAYRALAAKYHPDKNPSDQRAELKLKRLNAAFEVLSDPTKRWHYDEEGRHARERRAASVQAPRTSSRTPETGEPYPREPAAPASSNQAQPPRTSPPRPTGRAYAFGRATRRVLRNLIRTRTRRFASAAVMIVVSWALVRNTSGGPPREETTRFQIRALPSAALSPGPPSAAPPEAVPVATSDNPFRVGMFVAISPQGLRRNGRRPLKDQAGVVTVLDPDGERLYVDYKGDILTFDQSEIGLLQRMYSEFEFFGEDGESERYTPTETDTPVRNLVRRESDLTSFRNGGLRFSTSGIVTRKLGTRDVEVLRVGSSLAFVERCPQRTCVRILRIKDRWRADVRGFESTYLVTIEPNALSNERTVSNFTGYSRPIRH